MGTQVLIGLFVKKRKEWLFEVIASRNKWKMFSFTIQKGSFKIALEAGFGPESDYVSLFYTTGGKPQTITWM